MPEGESGINIRHRLGSIARGLGLAMVLAGGGGIGWSLAAWQDVALSSESVLAGVEPAGNSGGLPLDVAAGPTLAEAEPMPEVPAEEEAASLAALLDKPALGEGDAPLAADPPASDPYLAVLDPRDRPVLLLAAEASESAQAEGAASAGLLGASRRIGAMLRYVVEPGDTLETIANHFGVNVALLQSANRLGSDNLLPVGQSLLVPTVNGPVHVVRPGESLSEIAANYGVDPEAVVLANDIEDGSLIAPGQRLLIPGGVRPAPPVSASAPTARPTATPATRPTPSAPLASAPPPARPTASPGTTSAPAPALASRAAPVSLPGGPLAWPLSGIITQRFGENGHTGLDIAAPLGTPLKAAAPGTVTVAAKLPYGYGWRIVIDHGGGYSTLYAHLSAFSVAEGARVARGQVIGAVGSTGLATGPHLHFEVVVNGQQTDPLKFLP